MGQTWRDGLAFAGWVLAIGGLGFAFVALGAR